MEVTDTRQSFWGPINRSMNSVERFSSEDLLPHPHERRQIWFPLLVKTTQLRTPQPIQRWDKKVRAQHCTKFSSGRDLVPLPPCAPFTVISIWDITETEQTSLLLQNDPRKATQTWGWPQAREKHGGMEHNLRCGWRWLIHQDGWEKGHLPKRNQRNQICAEHNG